MNRTLGCSLGIFVLCTSCAGASPPSPSEDSSALETPAADERTGTEVAVDDPSPDPDPCIDGDVCNDSFASFAMQAEPDVELGARRPPSDYVTGAHLLVVTYAPLHATPSPTSALVTSIAPQGGVPRDGLHQWGQPKGYVTPGQIVVLASPTPTSGFWEVDYAGKRGWILGTKTTLANTRGMHPVDYALQPNVRNAFFKNQLHRNLWNKDGPASSGNCAPTSLAMALHVFSEEPTGESIEESIHRVRLAYGQHSDNASTSRLEIHEAALRLGLQVHDLATDVSPAAALTRLAGQLEGRRVVVLQGLPGAPGSAPTLYQRAMDRAYAAAARRGQVLHDRTYTFDGFHSIFVLGRDKSGGFVVGDPLSEVGFVTLTAAEMKDFVTRWVGNRGTGTAVWR